MQILPSTVLKYSSLTSRSFGIGTDTVDQGSNLIHLTIADAKRRLTAAGVKDPAEDDADYEAACAKVTTALLFRHFAADKARHTGLAGGRTGQSMTPLGSYGELKQASIDYYEEAKLIYPDADWPPFDTSRSAGSQRVRRIF